MNRTNKETQGKSGGREAVVLNCPACGAAARRAEAHFCATCGRGLRERTYAPGDALLASYHQQHSRPAMLIEREMRHSRGDEDKRALSNKLFDAPCDMITIGAFAFVVAAAFVPFVGIVFCLCVVVLGVIGMREARRERHTVDERRRATRRIVLGVVIFGAQMIFLYLLASLGII